MKKDKETSLQRIKEDLKDLEHFIEEFSVFLPLAVCTVTPMGIIMYTNRAFLRLTHYKEIEVIGKEIEILFGNKKEWEDLEKKILKEKLIEGKEMILISKTGEKIPASVSASLRKDEKGILVGYFLAFLDITEIKKLQEELEEKVKERTEELQERVDELEKFYKLTVGRELKLAELKKEIKRLKSELKSKKLNTK